MSQELFRAVLAIHLQHVLDAAFHPLVDMHQLCACSCYHIDSRFLLGAFLTDAAVSIIQGTVVVWRGNKRLDIDARPQ